MNANAAGDISSGDRSVQISKTTKIRAPGKFVLIAGLVWIVILATGFLTLAREEFTPATDATVGPAFPPRSALALAPDMPTLVFFAHPHCPCTRASMHEFAVLMSSLRYKVAATAVFTLPQGVAPQWEQGDLWQEAAMIPGVRVTTDRDGLEAKRFGVKGSGHVLLYQPDGRLVFSGGVTPSRGHEGDNPGRSAVANLVLQSRSPVSRTPVYGCPLLGEPASSRP